MNFVVVHHFQKENITPEMMTPHVAYLKALFDDGKLLMTGPFTDEKRGGMFVLDVKDEQELRDLVNNDPAIIAGLAISEVRPYKIVFSKLPGNKAEYKNQQV